MARPGAELKQGIPFQEDMFVFQGVPFQKRDVCFSSEGCDFNVEIFLRIINLVYPYNNRLLKYFEIHPISSLFSTKSVVILLRGNVVTFRKIIYNWI